MVQVLLGAKPVVQEVGPYVYTEEHHKSDLQWNTNTTVTYKQIRTWHFLPDRTPGSLDDQVSKLYSSSSICDFFLCLGKPPFVDKIFSQ
jgi:hypothetical protein